MARWFVQLRLLLWKNFLIQSRRKLSTVFEIILPIFFVFILLLLRVTDTIKVKNAGQDIWAPFQLNRTIPLKKTASENLFSSSYANSKVSFGLVKSKWTIAYAPNTTFYRNIMNNLPEFLDAKTQAFHDGDSLSKAVVTDEEYQISEQTFLCAVQFTSGDNGDDENIKYILRFPANSRVKYGDKKLQKFINFVPTKWYTQFAYPFTFGGMGPRNENLTVGGPPPYFREGFLSVQYGVDMAIIRSKLKPGAQFPNVTVQMRRFPYRDTIRDGFIVVTQNSLPLLLMLSLVYSALVMVKNIVYEKEKKLKESMKMMGLRNWLHWTAWFIKCFVFLVIPISVCAIMLCVQFGSGNRKMLIHSDGSLVFVFLLLYAISGIMFCFFVSTLFYRANIAAAGGGILWFLAYTPYFFLFNYYQQMSNTSRLLACFDFQVAMSFGGYLIGQFEGQGRGVQWSTLGEGVTVDQKFSFGQVLLMQVVDCILYGVLAWYIENVFPGEYGIPKKFYFPFSKKYWCDIQETEENIALIDNDVLQENFDADENDEKVFEKYPEDAKTGIRIHNLRKVFRTEAGEKIAVNNLSLSMLEGQITALLGHNGAGKTTTISMLTGLFPPTSGKAVVNGYDIAHNMPGIRESLGICPQHNVLFDTLTVQEHLIFFTMLKGVTDKKQIKAEVEHMIASTGLLDKRNVESRNLSGGMKRKLSVGCALVGDSKIVILDEPTSGMDVSARRFTWDLLQRERRGRTILLTTHFMDEADVLGDRIAIMAAGKVKCCGSSLYLKKKYGVGYHMVMVKDKKCNPIDVTNVVVKYVPTAQLESNIGFELSFILPSDFSHEFEELFTEIEEKREELGILSYGASVTTLEEVFIKVGEEQDEEAGLSSSKALFRQLSGREDAPIPREDTPMPREEPQRMSFADLHQSFEIQTIKNGGHKLFFQRWYAMFVKKVLHSRRHKLSIVSQLIMPSIFVLLALIVVKTLPNATKSPSLALDTTMFGKLQQVPYCSFNGDLSNRSIEYNCSQSSRIFSTSYDSVLKSETNSHPEVVSGKPMVDYLIGEEKKKDLGQFNLVFPIGFEAKRDEKTGYLLTAWFNNEALHTSAIALNVLTNVLLRNVTNDPNTRIQITNFPLPPTASQSNKDTKMNPIGFQIGFSLCFGMAFLASSFIVFLVQERASKAKHLQFVSGVDPISYWTSALLWDLINFLLPCIVIFVLFAIFSIDAYTGERLGYVALLLLLYGWAIIPMMYIFSYFFDVASTAFTRMTILNVITGLATLLVVYILSIPSLDLIDVAADLKWAFLALPNYNLGQGMIDLFNNYQFQHAFGNENAVEMCVQLAKTMHFPFKDQDIRDLCKVSLRTYHQGRIDVNKCIIDDKNSAVGKKHPLLPYGLICNIIDEFFMNATSQFQWNYLAWDNPGIGRFLIFLAVEGFVFFGIVLMIEYRIFRNAFKTISRCMRSFMTRKNAVYVMTSDHLLDSDVLGEKHRVNGLRSGNDVLMIKDLTKVFYQRTGKPLVAVDHLSLGIPHGECFGLLGQNGAGKTTTFRILTGDETMSSGSACIDSYDVTKDLNEVRQRMGYCPQFDALIDLMTGRELLWMFCRLRGVPEQYIDKVAVKLAKELSVYEHIDKCSKTYSGGNKRKLSTAIALCGDPQLIFLDEPSSGMDPIARRMLWNSLSRVIAAGKSIVITSHSMEECEALCTRVAIMVNGQFKCLGSPQHLKNKFGEGYTLIARVSYSNEDTTSLLKLFIEQEFPGSLLKDEHQGYVHYQLRAESKTWANLFGIMEAAKQEYNIEDYSISQTTLEQVFLNFTRTQRDVED